MAIAVNDTIDKVESTLQDSGNLTWTAADLLGFLNEAQRKIVELKPDSYILRSSVQLVTGAKQALAAGETGLLEITRNMGTGGSTPGNAITLVNKADMDSSLLSWMNTTGTGTIIHYIYEPKDPKVFYVYPGVPASPAVYVEMARWGTPASISAGANITLDDIYEDPIMLWMKYKAWEKKRPDMAAGYRNMFVEALGLRDQREEFENPNMKPVKGGLP